MIGINQSIVSERQDTFGKLIDGVLLCGSEHLKTLSGRHINRDVQLALSWLGVLDTVRVKKRFAQFIPSSTEIRNSSAAPETIIL
jgi:hypothetical protein